MHEVAIAQGILDVVLDVADGGEVRTIRVRAGELQAVTQDSLQLCFEMVAFDTHAAAARLEVDIIPGDDLFIDAIELDDGWHFRPDAAADVQEAPHVHAEATT
jgi:Zn finger protein HypA/HybF involved in hydrogenase expression